MSTAVLVYDDHDTSISYSSGHWGQAGVIEEFKSTTSWTIHKGATANLTFLGTSVSVWGTISNFGDAPISSYSVDGGDEETYKATILQNIQYQRQFFQSKDLTLASHTLVITILSEDAEFFLDYISVTPNVTTSPSLSSSLAPTLSTSSTLTPIVSSRTASAIITTRSATTSSLDSSKDELPLGPIIGGALGGLALLVFAFIGFMFLWKKSKGRSYEMNPTFTNNSSLWTRVPMANDGVTPFRTHLYHPLPNPSIHHSESVYKRPLVPVSAPLPPPLGTFPPSGLSQYSSLSQGAPSHGAATSSSALASTSTHQVSTSTTIHSDLSPPRYDG